MWPFNRKSSTEAEATRYIQILCNRCDNALTIAETNTSFAPVTGCLAYNLPMFLCDECIPLVIDNMGDGPGLQCLRAIDAEMAVNLIENMQFYHKDPEAMLFFTELFPNSPAVRAAARARLGESQHKPKILAPEPRHMRTDKANDGVRPAEIAEDKKVLKYAQKAAELKKKGKVEQSLEVLDKGLGEFPQNGRLLVEKADSLNGLHRPSDALSLLDGVDPAAHERYYLIKGILLGQVTNWDDAAECWKKQLELMPESIKTLDYLGYYYLRKKKDYATARVHYEYCCRAYPSVQQFHIYLGETMLRVGRRQLAQRYLGMARGMAPHEAMSVDADIDELLSRC